MTIIKKTRRNLLRIVLLILPVILWQQGANANGITLRGGWYANDPYQFTVPESTIPQGLDIELIKTIAKDADIQINIEPVAWKQHVADLKNGIRDVASGATYTDERSKFVYFSEPYRDEEDSLFVHRKLDSKIKIQSVQDFLIIVKKLNLKIGVLDGFVYADKKINDWINDPENAKHIVMSENDQGNIDAAVNHKVDGFLADRMVGSTIIWRKQLGQQFVEKRLNIKTPIYFMFSKKTVTPEIVQKFNASIKRLKGSKTYRQIIAWYWQPILLLQTIDSTWFNLIEIFGTLAFAISGLIIAYREKTTIFGAFIFAILPSLGGGIIRDVIFGRHPIGAMASPGFLELVIFTVAASYLLIQLHPIVMPKLKLSHKFNNTHLTQNILVVCDAMGLATFTVIGILVSLMSKVEPLWLWGAFFAFITGAGGGILRDLLSRGREITSFQGGIYPELAVIWGGGLAAFLMYISDSITVEPIQIATYVTVIGVFISRLLAYYFDIPNIHFCVHNKIHNKFIDKNAVL